MTDFRMLGRTGLRLLRWMDRRWAMAGVMIGGMLLGFLMRLGPGRISRTTAELWIPLAFGALALAAAVMAGFADRDERHADAHYDAFRRALDERDRRDASEDIR
jgi:hypothetical protein